MDVSLLLGMKDQIPVQDQIEECLDQNLVDLQKIETQTQRRRNNRWEDGNHLPDM
jgi:hypothetical protein